AASFVFAPTEIKVQRYTPHEDVGHPPRDLFGRPYGTCLVCLLFPALKRWANIGRPSGAGVLVGSALHGAREIPPYAFASVRDGRGGRNCAREFLVTPPSGGSNS